MSCTKICTNEQFPLYGITCNLFVCVLIVQGVFSVMFPHCDVYLVARLEKVLQGGLSACAEPYIKAGENIKV